jgi:hypothetical protein
MRVDVQQPITLAPGEALLTVTDATVGADALQFCVENPSLGFLQRPGAEKPWSTTMTWLDPDRVDADAAEPAMMRVVLGPQHTFHMKANVTYAISMRDGTGTVSKSRMSWPAIRLPSTPPSMQPQTPPDDRSGAAVLLENKNGATIPGPDDSTVKPIVTPPAPRQRKLILIAGSLLLLLLLVGGGGGWWYLRGDRPAPVPPVKPAPQPQVPAPEGPLGAPTARAFLGQQRSPADTYTEAERYQKAGTPDAVQGALILLNRAANDGNTSAQVALGKMYDPETFDPKVSAMKAPDPDKALLWYQRAAKANDPEALYREGKLLMSGRVQVPGESPESGVVMLRKAAELGSSDAQKAIDALSKNPQ